MALDRSKIGAAVVEDKVEAEATEGTEVVEVVADEAVEDAAGVDGGDDAFWHRHGLGYLIPPLRGTHYILSSLQLRR
jgi:hypothetical protein